MSHPAMAAANVQGLKRLAPEQRLFQHATWVIGTIAKDSPEEVIDWYVLRLKAMDFCGSMGGA